MGEVPLYEVLSFRLVDGCVPRIHTANPKRVSTLMVAEATQGPSGGYLESHFQEFFHFWQ